MRTPATISKAASVARRNGEISQAMSQHRRISPFFHWKSAMDPPLAALLLVMATPIIGLLWILVKCTSPGPGFYRQSRAGLYGRQFFMIKLRSMRQDAETASGAVWSVDGDPRVTPLGKILRKYHLDELPQLVNVIKGEMSLVGPRPERPEFVEVLAQQLDGYLDRLEVKPGITGLAQLNLPPDTDLKSVAEKLVLDLEYIKQAGPWLEARLLLCTAGRIVKVPLVRPLGLSRIVKEAAAVTVNCRDCEIPVAVVERPSKIITKGRPVHDAPHGSHDRLSAVLQGKPR